MVNLCLRRVVEADELTEVFDATLVWQNVDVHALNARRARARPAGPSRLVAQYLGFGRVQFESARLRCAHNIFEHRCEARKSLAGQEHVVGEAKVGECGGGGSPQLNALALLLPFGDQRF